MRIDPRRSMRRDSNHHRLNDPSDFIVRSRRLPIVSITASVHEPGVSTIRLLAARLIVTRLIVTRLIGHSSDRSFV